MRTWEPHGEKVRVCVRFMGMCGDPPRCFQPFMEGSPAYREGFAYILKWLRTGLDKADTGNERL